MWGTSASCWVHGATCGGAHFMLQGHDVLTCPNVCFQVTVLHPISACINTIIEQDYLWCQRTDLRLKCHKDGMTHEAIHSPVFKIETAWRFHHFGGKKWGENWKSASHCEVHCSVCKSTFKGIEYWTFVRSLSCFNLQHERKRWGSTKKRPHMVSEKQNHHSYQCVAQKEKERIFESEPQMNGRPL